MIINQTGICRSTHVLTPPPGPLPKDGEGEKSWPGDCVPMPIERISAGNLVLTHKNRFMPVLRTDRLDYSGEIIEITLARDSVPLRVAPGQLLATCAPPLPDYGTAVSTVRSLRRNPTYAEALLWKRLCESQTGAKFRRQQPMGRFVLDFYSPEVRLAVEVDGSVHRLADQKEYDEFRQQLIEHDMIEFVRLSNEEIMRSPVRAAAGIAVKVKERRASFDYVIRWMRAGEIAKGARVPHWGSRESIMSIERTSATTELYLLRVSRENSVVTETCCLHC